MTPSDFDGANTVYTAPEGMSDCLDLPAVRLNDAGGPIISRWEPSNAERLEIEHGAPVWLWVHSGVQPPVSLTTHDPFGACQEHEPEHQAGAEPDRDELVDTLCDIIDVMRADGKDFGDIEESLEHEMRSALADALQFARDNQHT